MKISDCFSKRILNFFRTNRANDDQANASSSNMATEQTKHVDSQLSRRKSSLSSISMIYHFIGLDSINCVRCRFRCHSNNSRSTCWYRRILFSSDETTDSSIPQTTFTTTTAATTTTTPTSGLINQSNAILYGRSIRTDLWNTRSSDSMAYRCLANSLAISAVRSCRWSLSMKKKTKKRMHVYSGFYLYAQEIHTFTNNNQIEGDK